RHVRHRVRDALYSGWSRVKDVWRGAWLWVFALVAQYSAPLSRWAFRNRRRMLDVGCWPNRLAPELTNVQQPTANSRVDVFRYQTRHWHYDKLLQFVQSSTARYVLFQTVDGDPGALLPLFSDSRTFAVSRQVDYRDWKPSLFATAPFRRLQPGEA